MKTIVSFFLCLFIAVNGFGQQDSSRPGKKQKESIKQNPDKKALLTYRKIKSKISLDSAQSAEVRKILIEREREKEKARKLYPEKSEKRRIAIREIHLKYDEKLKSVMSEDQWKKFLEIRKDMVKKHKEKVKSRKSGHVVPDSDDEPDMEEN